MNDDSLSQTLHFAVIALIAGGVLLSGMLLVTRSFGLLSQQQAIAVLVISVFELVLYLQGRRGLPKRIDALKRMERRRGEDEFAFMSRDMSGPIEDRIQAYVRKYWTEHLTIGVLGSAGIALRMLTTEWLTRSIGFIIIVIVLLFFYRNLTEDPEKSLQIDKRVSATGRA